MPIEFPSFELQASPSALKQLSRGIDGWRVDGSNSNASNIWLKSSDGAVWRIGIFRREVRPRFDVFTLGMLSMAELHQRWQRWQPPALPKEAHKGVRQQRMTRPPAPTAPTEFDPWPLRSWRTEVVRRAEYVRETEGAGSKAGDPAKKLCETRPPAVPADASAYCEVAAGLLFTGDEGRRVLIAVDWMPMNMLVVEDAADIGTLGPECELIGMEAYPHHIRRQSSRAAPRTLHRITELNQEDQ